MILLIIQVKNVILGNLKLNEFFNIGCQFINFILLFIFMIDIKISDKKIFLFMKCLVYMGMIACIHNVILYFGEMFQTLGFMKGAYMVHIKSFFANRNQFAFFLYVAIIADLFLVEKENNKRYKFFLLIFLINLFFTMSRTGLATVTLLGVFYLIFTKKISNKIK